jgi:hypothetical protein
MVRRSELPAGTSMGGVIAKKRSFDVYRIFGTPRAGEPSANNIV